MTVISEKKQSILRDDDQKIIFLNCSFIEEICYLYVPKRCLAEDQMIRFWQRVLRITVSSSSSAQGISRSCLNKIFSLAYSCAASSVNLTFFVGVQFMFCMVC